MAAEFKRSSTMLGQEDTISWRSPENILTVAALEEKLRQNTNMTTENNSTSSCKRLQQGESIERTDVKGHNLVLGIGSLLLEMRIHGVLITLRNKTRRAEGYEKNLALPCLRQLGIKGDDSWIWTYARECRKPKRVKDYAYHKEKMMMCKQAEQGVPLQAEQADWLEDTDEEIDEQELEAHYSYMAKIQEVSPEESSSTSQPLEQENKTVLKQLKKANASLTQELKECKTNLDETSRALGEATSSRDSCLIALQTKQTELEKYTVLNDRTIVNQKHDELVKKSLLTRSQFEGQLKEKSKVISDLKVKEGKDIDTMIEMDKQIKFLNEILYKRNQSIKTFTMEMHDDVEFVKSLEMEIDKLESDKADFSYILIYLSKRVIHTTSVSRPQLKCYQVKDKVVPNNSQVKFQKKEVEDHHRISSISKKTKSVTTCNDSSNSRTSNENAVCAECGTCVFNSNHDACVSRYLKDVNARTKKPNVVPISASKPKRKANKSVATPHKKTVALDTTIQKSKSYYKELYENTNQEWKWWIAKRCPSGYTWTQKPLKTKKIWMPKIRKDDESTRSNSVPCSIKFLGTVHFGNDQFAPILGYGDLIQGNVTIKRENLTCFVRDPLGKRFTNWLVVDRSLTQYLFKKQLHQLQSVSWLKLHQLKHGSTLFVLSSFKTKAVPSSKGRLNLLHMDLCGPMRDETPEVLKDFLKMIQRNLQAQVITIRIDRGTEFLNKTLHAYFKEEGIEHQTSTPRTPEQNDVVERRNRTLVEAARTML
ncbi:retrovirus-related pol polyprotein from transposon TNT 1-94 [Tanacetum coccineum]